MVNPLPGVAESKEQSSSDTGTAHYWGGGRRQVHDIALHLIAENAGWPVLEGPTGAGKSWLLQRIREELGQVGLDTIVDPATRNPADMTPAAQQTCCLCMDSVDPNDPAMIQRLETAARDGLRLLLAGQPGLATALSRQLSTDLAQRLHRINVRNLDRNETREFIRLVRPTAPEGDSKRLAAKLFRATNGNPGAILVQISRPGPARSPVDFLSRNRPPIVGVALLILLLSVLVTALLRTAPPHEEGTESAHRAAATDSVADSAPSEPLAAEAPVLSFDEPATGLETPGDPEKRSDLLPDIAEAVTSAEPLSGESSTPRRAPDTSSSDDALSDTSSPARPPTDLPEQPDTSQVASREAVSNAPATKSTGDPRYRREAWLLTVDPNAAALQLMLHSEETRIQALIDNNNLHAQAAYYVKQVDGKPLYCLILGPFDDMAAADTARQRLPEALRAQQPWRRTFANIQADIRARQRPGKP